MTKHAKALDERPLRAERPAKVHTAERRLADTVAELLSQDRRIIAGPWLGEVGYEVLYWIPLLRYCVSRWPELGDRLVVVSRGGVGHWYDGVAQTYVDVFEAYDEETYLEHLAADRRIRIALGMNSVKQHGETAWEREIVAWVSDRLGEARLPTLHPSILWNGKLIKFVPRFAEAESSVYSPWERPDRGRLGPVLPERYVAVRFSRSGLFGDEVFAEAATRALAREMPVVALYPGMTTDPQHPDFILDADIIPLAPHIAFKDNLAMQSTAIANSSAFVGNFGGLAYLAPHYGVPSYCFWSHLSKGVVRERELTSRIFSGPGWGSIAIRSVDEAPIDELLAPVLRGRS